MFKAIQILFLCLWGSIAFAQSKGPVLFDGDWRFFRGASQLASQPNFDDSHWRKIDLPHDWSTEDLPGKDSPFDSAAVGQSSIGFTTGGTGWYRKTFDVPAADSDQHVIIQFDGVYMNADVWVNGHHLGNHPYGYTSFYYDISPHLKFGKANIIAVEVKNEGYNSRWYSGSGIYRHVWIKTVAPVHIEQWGQAITTPSVSRSAATVAVRTSVQNESAVPVNTRVQVRILDASGAEVAHGNIDQQLPAKDTAHIAQTIQLADPHLWSPDHPSLYTAVTTIQVNGAIVAQQTNTFGVRSLSFSTNGFLLNGESLKLKGGCFHHDNGPLGSRAYDRAEERKVALLKASGFNAIRCSHNPPSPAFLDACDRVGMLVIDEAFDMWNYEKTPFDYHLYFRDWHQRDINSMVMRDRNHPSVIMWSIGNEIPERGTPEGAATAGLLAGYIKAIDTTRPITAAVNDGSQVNKDAYFAQLDVGGYNYAVFDNQDTVFNYKKDHARVPGRIMVGTESYPLTAYGAWKAVEDNPYVIGDFVWTAFDYRGEASIGWLGFSRTVSVYPWNLAYCGDIDICGWKRPQSYYRDVLWKTDQLSVFVRAPRPTYTLNPEAFVWAKWNWQDVLADWNWSGEEGKPLEVNVYSSCEQVELFFNNKSLGKKATNHANEYIATWMVPYAAGELKAVGYRGKKKIKETVLRTAGAVAQLQLSADRDSLRADGQDLSYITVSLTDAQGTLHPRADNPVHFTLEGPGKIIGVGNADPQSLESSELPTRKAWHGKCLVIVKMGTQPGRIVLHAQSDGLPDASVSLDVK